MQSQVGESTKPACLPLAVPLTPAGLSTSCSAPTARFTQGVTNDLPKRLKAHALGKASKYTRSRLPVKLADSEPQKSKSAALKPNLFLRRYSRSMKTDSLLSITNRSMSSNRACRRLAI